MKKTALLFVLLSQWLSAQYRLSVQVEDIYRYQPVETAYIRLHTENGKTFYYKTDKTGRALIPAQGKIRLEVVAKDYRPLSSRFDLSGDLKVSFLLEPVGFDFPENPEVFLLAKIFDAETYEPLAGKVTISLPGYTYSTTFASGKWAVDRKTFESVWGRYKEDDTIRYQLEVPGYQTLIVSERIPKAFTVKDFRLKKIRTYENRREFSVPLNPDKKIKALFEKNASKPATQTQCNRMPANIRVGTNCSCNTCSNVQVMSLEAYVRTGLNDEWIASWHLESLKAGALPYRTYGAYYVYHPIHSNYDIANTTCKQVWDADYSTRCVQAQQATQGQYIETPGGAVAFSEYSAENNCLNTTACNCGDGYAGNGTDWPCIQDAVCAGHDRYGHGRGMCQWGTSRWANNGQVYTWMADHYYNPGNYFRCGTTHPHPDFAVTNAQASASSGAPGNPVTLQVRIENNTSYKTDKNKVAFYFSQDNQLDAGDILLSDATLWPINPHDHSDKSVNVTVPNQPDGNYYFLMIADPEDQMYETDENNNVAAVPFTLNTTAVEENIITRNLEIFPNPTKNDIHLKANIPLSVRSIRLTGLSGRLLLSFDAFQNKISLRSFPRGTYLLFISDKEGNRAVYKIIKQ